MRATGSTFLDFLYVLDPVIIIFPDWQSLLSNLEDSTVLGSRRGPALRQRVGMGKDQECKMIEHCPLSSLPDQARQRSYRSEQCVCV